VLNDDTTIDMFILNKKHFFLSRLTSLSSQNPNQTALYSFLRFQTRECGFNAQQMGVTWLNIVNEAESGRSTWQSFEGGVTF